MENKPVRIQNADKKCNKCNKILPVSEFTKSKQKNKTGWAYRSHCKNCCNERTRIYAASNKGRRNERLKHYRKNNPEKMKIIDRKRRLKIKYGLTVDALILMKEANAGKCWICNRKTENLFVDHCHNSNKVRGILCPQCNTFLGVIKDNIETLDRIKSYLIGQVHADVLLKIVNP